MRHMPTATGPLICETERTIERVIDTTRAIFGAINCPDCLRPAIAESEGRMHVLRELLDKVEVSS